MGLAIGLLIGFAGGPGSSGSLMAADRTSGVTETAGAEGPGGIAGNSPEAVAPALAGAVQSPLYDLSLDHLAADSSADGAEYVIEPYIPDPQHGVVPAGLQHTVSGSRNSESEVYITF